MACLMEHRRRLMAIANYPIPPGYKKCDYLVSVGAGAHIDTGVSGNDDTLEIDLTVMAEEQYNYAGFIGNYSSSSLKSWRVILGTNTQTLYANINSGGTVTLKPAGGSTIGEKLSIHLGRASASVRDSAGTYSATPAAATGSDSSSHIALGRFAVLSGATNNQDYRRRTYGCKIWRDGTLIRNYLPCVRMRDNIPGFWDTVNRTFSPSIAASHFIAGYD